MPAQRHQLLADFGALADKPALRFPERALSYAELGAQSAALARRLRGARRVAVLAEPRVETCVAVVAALRAGVVVVPVNPGIGSRELEHVLGDSAPDLLVCAPAAQPPPAAAALPRVTVGETPADGAAHDAADAEDVPLEQPALVLYTSGTTGPPKGVQLSRRAIAANLDALAEAWAWTGADVLVHALPLFHAHGLVLGILGPLRRGGSVRHTGRFSPETLAAGLEEGGTLLFAVPTMYHRLAEACERDEGVAAALRRARLLVSGSAALPEREHARIERATGQRVIQRYGLTETLMVTAMRADGDRRAGTVGPPVPGVEVRLLGDDGAVLDAHDDETIGEVAVRGPSLFDGYLNLPEATAAATAGGWFRTGDMATRAADGGLRIVGRRSTDIVKTGGYKVGAGEVEAALLEHPAVSEAAVLGLPDDDLGERIAAWVVLRDGASVAGEELSEHVRGLLGAHKRPRDVRFVQELPRNAMGKLQKTVLRERATGA